MKASTHTEVYRRFEGQLVERRLRFVPLFRANLRTAFKRKLPLFLLLTPPAIATIVLSFVVYSAFSVQSGETPEALGGGAGAGEALASMMLAGMAQQLTQVRTYIVIFHSSMSAFAALVMAWYGAGLLAEDRRVGAHLLYFARPLTRLDYVLAKFLVVAVFGSLVAILPALIICTIAAFASPDWSFLTNEGWIIPRTILFGMLVVLVIGSVVLAVSSLAARKTYALAGFFGYFMLAGALATLLARLQREARFKALAPGQSLARIATDLFELPGDRRPIPIEWAWGSIAAITLLAWIVVWQRVKRLEVVA